MAKTTGMQKTLWFPLRKLKLCRGEDKEVLEAKTNQNDCRKSSAVALKRFNLSVAVLTDLPEGNSTRKIVEMIFKSSWLKPGSMNHVKLERVVKINHREDILSRFEEYRETVKRKSGKKCSRCTADGNEMMRFHGTTVRCSLNVINGVVKLCSLEGCNGCSILRTVFSYKCGGILTGIYTTASSGVAHDSIDVHGQNNGGSTIAVKRGMLVCRVIAGHVHKPLNSHDQSSWKQVGTESVSGDGGDTCKPEEVLQSNARAFLPCFLIVYSMTK